MSSYNGRGGGSLLKLKSQSQASSKSFKGFEVKKKSATMFVGNPCHVPAIKRNFFCESNVINGGNQRTNGDGGNFRQFLFFLIFLGLPFSCFPIKAVALFILLE